MHSVWKHTANKTVVALVALVALVSVVEVIWFDVVLGNFITMFIDTCITDGVGLLM